MEKLKLLESGIRKYHSALIAFSGGVDSTFLAYYTHKVLNGNVLLVTATSSTYPFFELEEAKELAVKYNLKHKIINSEETDIPGFSDNPPDRCYYCKRELFSILIEIAKKEGYAAVFDGSNADDLNDYRPGMKAKKEYGVISPLCDAGLTKNDIRALSGQFGLPTADKPAYACLASRFPYGEKITITKLNRAEKTESEIRTLGLKQFRVRSHNNLARIEVAPGELEDAWKNKEKLHEICKSAGFVYVTLDLQGYRTGAMNEEIVNPN